MRIRPFLDPLPIPRVLQPKEQGKESTFYEVRMQEFFHQFHSQLKATKVWGYEGQVPGPTIETEEGECTHVRWINELPDKHLLPVDRTLHGSGHDMPEVRTVVHLHGAEVKPESDGYPDAWFTRNFEKCGPRFTQKVYTYSNSQRPATLWYHDHTVGITRLNVYAGLAGMYIIRNEQEKALNLPSGIYEIPLIIQDKTFNEEDHSLFYPKNIENPPPGYPEVSITPGFAGDTIIVNGKAWPYLEVEQRKYRFRILNASNERFYRMKLSSGQSLIQIGSDGGLLQKPAVLDEVTIAPAERIDLVVDFAGQPAGSKIVLINTARTPFNFGSEPDPSTVGQIMQFRVIARTSDDTSAVPGFLSNIKRYEEGDITRTRDITINVSTDQYTRPLFLLNNHEYMDGISEEPVISETECWRIINGGLGVHPIHIHQIQFQILDQIPFDTALYSQTGRLRFTGEPEPPPANQRGWKDTVQAFPGFVTRLVMRFGPYTGRYIYHCHILEHEDHDMMRPFDVVKRKCKCEETDSCK
ncbi:MAG TPA: copper oxidase [Ruminiclostridium sp.]|nr:copper oxidase [Ruminiclostridium sp.]